MNSNQCIFAESLGEVWLKCLSLIVRAGTWTVDDSERLLEVCSVFAGIHSIDDTDRIILQFADPERISLMREKYTFCGVLPQYKISYGKLLYDNNGTNQVEWVIQRLRTKRETKSATIAFHQAGDTILSCLSMLDFKIRDDQLIMTAVYRSQNIFGSQPGNLLALQDVQARIADAMQCQKGPVELLIASAHVYERDLEAVQRILNDVRALPSTDGFRNHIEPSSRELMHR